MKGKKIPQIIKHELERSVTLGFHKPAYSLIWLHGLADEAESYIPFFTHLRSPLYHHCRVKLITAPKRFVTINQAEDNAWFDIKSTGRFTSPEEQVYNFSHL
jgi:hypothetical protein